MQFLFSIWKMLHLTEYFYTGTAHGARNNYQVCTHDHHLRRICSKEKWEPPHKGELTSAVLSPILTVVGEQRNSNQPRYKKRSHAFSCKYTSGETLWLVYCNILQYIAIYWISWIYCNILDILQYIGYVAIYWIY